MGFAGLGGEAAQNPSGRFVLHVEEIRLSPKLLDEPCFVQALKDWKETQLGHISQHQGQSCAAAMQGSIVASDRQCDTVGITSPEADGVSQQLCESLTCLDHAPATIGTTASLQLLQSHGDQVVTLPEGAVQLAESDTALFEIWSWGSNVLAIQVSAGNNMLDAELCMI